MSDLAGFLMTLYCFAYVCDFFVVSLRLTLTFFFYALSSFVLYEIMCGSKEMLFVTVVLDWLFAFGVKTAVVWLLLLKEDNDEWRELVRPPQHFADYDSGCIIQ